MLTHPRTSAAAHSRERWHQFNQMNRPKIG